MTTTEKIAFAALVISALSFLVASASFWRTSRKERPVVWLTLAATTTPNLWDMTIHVHNLSAYTWRVVKAILPIKGIPLQQKQDFFIFLPATDGISEIECAVALRFNSEQEFLIAPSETRAIALRIMRANLSNSINLRLSLILQSQIESPRYKTLKLRATLPIGGTKFLID